MAAPNVEEFDGELRCGGTMHGVIKYHHGVRCLETKCHHIRCKEGKPVSVLHYFSLDTGVLVDTVIFQDPASRMRKL
jgi:hypothetical protein